MGNSETSDELSSSAVITDHVSATHTRAGHVVGFTESRGRDRAASSDLESQGTVAIQVTGQSPKGEEGTLAACRHLVRHLNSSGAEWSSPVQINGVQDIDAIVQGTGPQAGQELKLQVVRALTTQEFWRSLSYQQDISIQLSMRQAADALKAAITLKVRKIDSIIRERLTLVLDATDVPGLSFDIVLEQFNVLYGEWAHAQGFAAIWVVGPGTNMVHELHRARA